MSDVIEHADLFMNSPESEAEEIGPGLKRKLLGHDAHLMLVKVWFDKGAVGEVHSHPHSQGSYVISGSFEVQVDGKTEILGPGGTFFVPSGADHGAVCLEAGILLDVFSPARRDFLGLEETP
jgi:quercetin dioxygenase-like cupin family protein